MSHGHANMAFPLPAHRCIFALPLGVFCCYCILVNCEFINPLSLSFVHICLISTSSCRPSPQVLNTFHIGTRLFSTLHIRVEGIVSYFFIHGTMDCSPVGMKWHGWYLGNRWSELNPANQVKGCVHCVSPNLSHHDNDTRNIIIKWQHFECRHIVTTFKMSSLSDQIFFSGFNHTRSYVRSDNVQNVIT